MDLEGLISLVDVLLVHDHIRVSLANVHGEADLLEREQLVRTFLHELESFICLGHLPLLPRVLLGVEVVVDGFVDELDRRDYGVTVDVDYLLGIYHLWYCFLLLI